jgi:ferric-dicitrate binding protein FerR (iron transport regulator)
MSSDSSPDIPASLRERLREEEADEQADLETVWALLGTVDPPGSSSPNLQDEWEALRARRPDLDADRPLNGRAPADRSAATRLSSRRPSPPPRTRGRWAGAVAVLLVLVAVGAWLWHQPVTLSAESGQQRTATLPDGSTVELNSGTTLSYRRGFRAWPLVAADRRTVQLTGEAFFRVQDGSRPFVVETAAARVTVEGTRFNVRSRPAVDSSSTVTLAEGRIEVSARTRPDRAVVLERNGQRTRVSGRGAPPSAPDSAPIDHVLAWRQDGFAASEEPLTQVLRELERRYDTSIRLHDSVQRTTAPVSLYYPEPAELADILRDLCTALDLNYRPTGRGYALFVPSSRR